MMNLLLNFIQLLMLNILKNILKMELFNQAIHDGGFSAVLIPIGDCCYSRSSTKYHSVPSHNSTSRFPITIV